MLVPFGHTLVECQSTELKNGPWSTIRFRPAVLTICMHTLDSTTVAGLSHAMQHALLYWCTVDIVTVKTYHYSHQSALILDLDLDL